MGILIDDPRKPATVKYRPWEELTPKEKRAGFELWMTQDEKDRHGFWGESK